MQKIVITLLFLGLSLNTFAQITGVNVDTVRQIQGKVKEGEAEIAKNLVLLYFTYRRGLIARPFNLTSKWR